MSSQNSQRVELIPKGGICAHIFFFLVFVYQVHGSSFQKFSCTKPGFKEQTDPWSQFISNIQAKKCIFCTNFYWKTKIKLNPCFLLKERNKIYFEKKNYSSLAQFSFQKTQLFLTTRHPLLNPVDHGSCSVFYEYL